MIAGEGVRASASSLIRRMGGLFTRPRNGLGSLSRTAHLSPHIAAITLILLPGCATTQTVPEKVYIPVSQPCITAADLPKSPAFPSDAELAKLDDFALVIAIRSAQIAYRQYVSELEATLRACTK